MNIQCIPLSDNEVREVYKSFTGTFALRNRALFILGCSTGFRISELLSVQVKHVVSGRKVKEFLTISKAKMKGRKKSRTAFLPHGTQTVLNELITYLRSFGVCLPDDYLFCNKSGRVISRQAAWCFLKKAYARAELEGNLATHTMRKTYARNELQYAEKNRNDIEVQPLIFLFQQMGHVKIDSTMKYIESFTTRHTKGGATEATEKWLT